MAMATYPPDSVQQQILYIGSEPEFADSVEELISTESQVLHVQQNDWREAEWQRSRLPVTALAIVDLGPDAPFSELLQCVQTVSLVFRPEALVAVRMDTTQEQDLILVKAGATALGRAGESPEELMNLLQQPGINHEELFPDPARWLNTLVRTAEDLRLGGDDGPQVKRLLRQFASRLDVDRASLGLLEGERKLRMQAIINLPEVEENQLLEISPDSITAWVIDHRRARLVEGAYHTSQAARSKARSAICAPLIADDVVIGVVNFSSTSEGRLLSRPDLAAAEVFASLLAMTIRNHRMHGELMEQQRLAAVGSTIGSVSHCIKNLLTILNGSAMIIEKGLRNEDFGQSAAGFKIMQKGIGRVQSLVLDLLDFTKDRAPDLTLVNIDEMFSSVAENFMVMNMEEKHSLAVCSEIEDPVLIDECRLHRAVMNLVSNAMDATPNGGRIEVTARLRDSMVELSVEDSGPGVPESKIESIFDAFFSTKGSKGTGLGLAMVKKFCVENGGDVRAEGSANLGGLKVTLTLPYMQKLPSSG